MDDHVGHVSKGYRRSITYIGGKKINAKREKGHQYMFRSADRQSYRL